ncbi:hypothetical protein MMC27_005875 [Xylographa pallens]|nr:hypothetical protein [Xylographa pallens]
MPTLNDHIWAPTHHYIVAEQASVRLAMFVSRLEGDLKGIVQFYNYAIGLLVAKNEAVPDPSTSDIAAAALFIKSGTNALIELVKDRHPHNANTERSDPTKDQITHGLLRGMYNEPVELSWKKDFWTAREFILESLWTDPDTKKHFEGTLPPIFRKVTQEECPVMEVVINKTIEVDRKYFVVIESKEQPTLRDLTEKKYDFKIFLFDDAFILPPESRIRPTMPNSLIDDSSDQDVPLSD